MTQQLAAYRDGYFRSQDGLRLHFREYGDPYSTRTPVLCLSGLTRNSGDYERLATLLAPHRRVIALDYRGRGLSDYDRDWRHYDVAVYINDVHHLLVATGAHRVVVLGTSLGGIIAMAMAAYFPTTLAAVVLNDVGPILNTAWVAKMLWYIGEDRPQPDLDTAVAQMHDLLPHLDKRSPEDWRWIAKNTFRRRADGQLHFDWDVNLVKALLRRRRIPDMWPWYRALRSIPTLALRGAQSKVLSPQTLEAMLCEKPDLTALTVGGAGHVPLLDEPDAAAALDEFFDAH